MLMRLRMLKLSVGKGRQIMKQLCCRVLQYYATVATERAGYVLYRALVMFVEDKMLCPQACEPVANIEFILTLLIKRSYAHYIVYINYSHNHRFPSVLSTVKMVANVSQSTTVALSLRGASVPQASVELSVRLEARVHQLQVKCNNTVRGRIKPLSITNSSSGRWLRGQARLPIISSSSISGSQLVVNKARDRTESITNSRGGSSDDVV